MSRVVVKWVMGSCLLVSLQGCGYFNRVYTYYTGGLTYKCARGGAEYVQSDSGLAPHVSPVTGLPYKCDRWRVSEKEMKEQ